jgi:hypothetical protein
MAKPAEGWISLHESECEFADVTHDAAPVQFIRVDPATVSVNEMFPRNVVRRRAIYISLIQAIWELGDKVLSALAPDCSTSLQEVPPTTNSTSRRLKLNT